MALWDRIKESASTMQTQLVAKKNDLKSGAFRDASMAMCALVAAADGTIDPAERQRVAQLIAANEVLQNFPADDLRRRLSYCREPDDREQRIIEPGGGAASPRWLR